ncbi:MAG TPA: Mur ligase family protein [Candidatus Limnocylindrales bacterium]|nr:Mur ligase family protein [Candidatus Limnocylindrales bacterium]
MTRTAAEIGAGLAPVRAPRGLRPAERIHVVGIAGAGASAAALLAAGSGAAVSGCDPGGPSPYTPPLEAAGVPIEWRHDAGHVERDPNARPERLAVTKALTSVDAENPELAAARRLGIPVEPWQQVIADAGAGKRVAAVAGTHGKSTSAGWLTHVLASSGRDPSAFVGALLPPTITGGLPATARIGRGSELVVEADEYAGNFDAYRPALVVLTNIDWDHPDVFADRDAVIEAFAAWIAKVPRATLVANAGDEGVRQLLQRVGRRDGPTLTVGTGGPSSAVQPSLAVRITGSRPDGTRVAFEGAGVTSAEAVELRLPGRHNVANAAGVACAALALGLSWPQVADALATFDGVGRRLERRGELAGVVVYDDYGHHPTAIRATLEAVRQREPGRRVWVAHEPLTFHRTAALEPELADALAEADGIVVADIWPGRDPDRTIASAAGLAEAVRKRAAGKTVAAPGSVDDSAAWLLDHIRPGDAVLVMGGGRSYRIAELVLAGLEVRTDGAG